MQIQQSGPEFSKFRESSRDGEAANGMAANIFQRPARKITHIDQRFFRQIIERFDREFRSRSGCSSRMFDSHRPRNIDGAVD